MDHLLSKDRPRSNPRSTSKPLLYPTPTQLMPCIYLDRGSVQAVLYNLVSGIEGFLIVWPSY